MNWEKFLAKRLSRRDALRVTGIAVGTGVAALAGCKAQRQEKVFPTPQPQATTVPTEALVSPTVVSTVAPTVAPTVAGERAVAFRGRLLVPPEVAAEGKGAVKAYLTKLIYQGPTSVETGLEGLPYINNPGMLPDNDEEPALLTGRKEAGQSQAALALQVTNAETRLIAGGQFVLPLTQEAAAELDVIETIQESTRRGTINTHIVFEKVTLADGRPGILIPGGRDEDHSVWTPEDNYNRGNVLIVLPPEKQGNTALFAQVDTGSNWQAQFNPSQKVAAEGGLRADRLLPYLLYSSDAQRSEGHGMATMESIYRGANCQGSGCRTADDEGNPLAAMAGVGVYVVQISPQGEAVDLLGATVIPDSVLRGMYP